MEFKSPGSNSVPIHLAIGSFDPLSAEGPIALPSELTLVGYPEGMAGYYIVQFKGPILEKWKKAVLGAGARIFGYIPKFAFVVKMDDRTRETVSAMNPIRWIGIYQPAYRIAPGLWPTNSVNSDLPVEVIVSIFEGEDVAGLASEMRRLGGEIVQVSETGERLRLRISLERIPALSRLTGVKWIERMPEIKILPSIQ
ncbi:MAG: hypothetical protein GTN81_02765 [Proteobacteria bacterium]|nr:hypothetical protein [Pseudomonadota bacterium]